MAKIFEIPFANNGDRDVVPAAAQGNGRVSYTQGFGPDYEKNLLTNIDAKDIERRKLNYLFYTICTAINKLQEDGGGVIGVPIPYPSTTNLPANHVPYDGRRFDTNLNPVLASIFPSGVLPDIRGVVIRALDAGRGLDPGRGILSYQEDCIQNITGGIPADIGNSGWINKPQGVWGAFYDNGPLTSGDQGSRGSEVRKYVFDASRVVRTGPEVRMKNIAFYYITKVG